MQESALITKTSVPIEVKSNGSLFLEDLTSFFSVGGNDSLSPYIQNAIADVMKSYTGTTNIASIKLTGTYGYGDKILDFTFDVPIKHFVLTEFEIPSVSLPEPSLELDSEKVF